MATATRFGDRTAYGAASFRCAKCGELAGVVRAARANSTVDMGPPLGKEIPGQDGLVLDYFLGTAWHAETRETLDTVQALINQGNIDPLAIRQINPAFWEITPFYCPKDWDTYVLLAEGFYDCTMGLCPNGHRHMLDD